MERDRSILLFLCGDVMTGRGIDQVLPHPGDPTLYESFVRDAREYVRLAERANDAIGRPVGYEYIWGDTLEELRRAGVDLRVINLETSVAASGDCWPDKQVLYRMNPRNVGCITSARIDCCCLANNHALDWGRAGLLETLKALDAAGLRRAGAGRNEAEAKAPAVLQAADKGRVLVFSLASVTSGIPPEWAATGDRPGVNLLADLSERTARRTAAEVREVKRPGDVTIASIHWGANWGYEIPQAQVRFAHELIDGGVDLIHGHSSHHVKALEVYRNRLIIYGSGDFLNDYEGISGHETFRGDLTLMYLPRVDPARGHLVELRLVPMQVRRLRLNRAARDDAEWLRDVLNRYERQFGTAAHLEPDGTLRVRWA